MDVDCGAFVANYASSALSQVDSIHVGSATLFSGRLAHVYLHNMHTYKYSHLTLVVGPVHTYWML